MIGSLLGGLLAWMPFVNPMTLPSGSRLWMFPPLALCIAVVYRATRARDSEQLVRRSLITFVYIIGGMVAIGLAAYILHLVVLAMG